jgi:methanogenic corrinoid protein MtbC1
MLTWCSYCQQFMGEEPPYERFIVTHGVCNGCMTDIDTLTESDLEHALALKGVQEQLAEAGRRGDLNAAKRIIEGTGGLSFRGVDLLMGVIAPILYQIGEDWRRDIATVAQEHRLTAFCESVYDLVAAKVSATMPAGTPSAMRTEFLLINAPGNCHTLAVRILALWLAQHGISSQVIARPLTVDDSIALISRVQPDVLLISLALAEQTAGVIAIVERIAELPNHNHPKTIVGGNAVKLGFVSAIPGATLMPDISLLAEFERHRVG